MMMSEKITVELKKDYWKRQGKAEIKREIMLKVIDSFDSLLNINSDDMKKYIKNRRNKLVEELNKDYWEQIEKQEKV